MQQPHRCPAPQQLHYRACTPFSGYFKTTFSPLSKIFPMMPFRVFGKGFTRHTRNSVIIIISQRRLLSMSGQQVCFSLKLRVILLADDCYLVLDPQIGLSTLLKDHESEREARGREHILCCKSSLKAHFEEHYLKVPNPLETPTPSSTNQQPDSFLSVVSTLSHQSFTPWGHFDFMACYRTSQALDLWPEDELVCFFRTSMTTSEKITIQDPLVWWRLHEAEFPNVARLARDVLSIPCMSYFLYTSETLMLMFLAIFLRFFCCSRKDIF